VTGSETRGQNFSWYRSAQTTAFRTVVLLYLDSGFDSSVPQDSNRKNGS